MDCLTSKLLTGPIPGHFQTVANLYSDIFRGFQAYLAGAPNYNFAMYKQLVHEITVAFKKISDEILAIKTQLSEVDSGVARIIAKIQEVEQQKLEAVTRNFFHCFFSINRFE